LERGHKFTITTDKARELDCDAQVLYMDYINLPKVVAPGKLIYVDDGLISLRVLEVVDNQNVLVEVVNSGKYVLTPQRDKVRVRVRVSVSVSVSE
jgi:pyruvate kinase